jgi:WD40 repeat protein
MRESLKSCSIVVKKIILSFWTIIAASLVVGIPIQQAPFNANLLTEINAKNANFVRELSHLSNGAIGGQADGTATFLEFSLSPDGTVAAVSTPFGVWIIDVATLEVLQQIPFESEKNLYFLSDQLIASGGVSGNIELWQLETQDYATYQIQDVNITDILFELAHDILVTVGEDNIVRVFDSNNYTIRHSFSFTDPIEKIGLTSDATSLITHTSRGMLSFWDLIDGTALTQTEIFGSMTVSDDGNYLLIYDASANDQTVRIWETEAIMRQGIEEYIAIYGETTPSQPQISPNNEVVALSDWSGNIHLISVNSGEELSLLEGHSSRVYHLQFNDTGTILVSAGTVQDTTLRFWGIFPPDS